MGAIISYASIISAPHDRTLMWLVRVRSGIGPRKFGLGFYDQIHAVAFKQTAGLLNKVNGFRGDNSWIYLPVPDKVRVSIRVVHERSVLSLRVRH